MMMTKGSSKRIVQRLTKKNVNCVQYLKEALLSVIRIHGCRFALQLAIFPAAVAVAVYVLEERHDFIKNILPEKSVYNNLCTLIILCTVFHVVQSYARFMSGLTLMYQMLGEIHDVASLLVTFIAQSKATRAKQQSYLDTLARLFSMMFAMCISELEDIGGKEEGKAAYNYDLLDPQGLDEKTLTTIVKSPDKAMCAYQQVLSFMMRAFESDVIDVPAPVFTRCFQELGNAMIKFHECLKFGDAPFPHVFMVVTDVLLLVYTVYTPFMFASWAAGPISAGLFTFITVIAVWLLHNVAEELENPFGHDFDDLKAEVLTQSLNDKLLHLLENAFAPVPHPSGVAVRGLSRALQDESIRAKCSQSFSSVISKIHDGARSVGIPLQKDPDWEHHWDIPSNTLPAEELDNAALVMHASAQQLRGVGIESSATLPSMHNVHQLPLHVVAWRTPRSQPLTTPTSARDIFGRSILESNRHAPRTPRDKPGSTSSAAGLQDPLHVDRGMTPSFCVDARSQPQTPPTSSRKASGRGALEFDTHSPPPANFGCTPRGNSRATNSDVGSEAFLLDGLV